MKKTPIAARFMEQIVKVNDLGQQLTTIGQVQLFEYQDPGYIPSCLLRT
jgi:hypothetical protein